MAMLNRSAIILIPKQLYADWANSLDDDGRRFEISEADDDLTVFLGPGYDTIEQIGAFATEHFDFFSEHWLEGWSLDAAEWPATPHRADASRVVQRPDPQDGRRRGRVPMS